MNNKSPYEGLSKEEMTAIKRANRMKMVDQYDPAIRSLIHEYGLSVVQAIVEAGVKKPKHIKHIVETVLDEFSPTRGSYSKQGVRTEVKR